jgi:acetamidase/formamidase
MAFHRFHPTVYHTTLGSHPPALRVADGDTIETTTVDARGYDAEQRQVAPPGNPQTGPFYIEGAEPGDTLVVELEQIVPNRRFGWSSTLVAPNVSEPRTIAQ